MGGRVTVRRGEALAHSDRGRGAQPRKARARQPAAEVIVDTPNDARLRGQLLADLQLLAGRFPQSHSGPMLSACCARLEREAHSMPSEKLAEALDIIDKAKRLAGLATGE